MTTSKRRRESAWKSRKQNRQPHGKISSLHELANDSNPGNNTDPST
ncbi:DUF6254 family protein [Cohnella terricola]|nr:DUF6254 family protein [Cohnella terricola]